MRLVRPPTIAVVAAAMLGGCGAGAPASDQAVNTLTRTTLPVDATRPDSLRLETRVPSRVRVGEAVPVTLAIRNEGGSPRELHFQGRTIAFDIVVEAADGSLVWRRLEGEAGLAILRVEVLAPGQVLTFSDRWLQQSRGGRPVAPGNYTIHGEFPSDAPEPLRTPAVRVRVVP